MPVLYPQARAAVEAAAGDLPVRDRRTTSRRRAPRPRGGCGAGCRARTSPRSTRPSTPTGCPAASTSRRGPAGRHGAPARWRVRLPRRRGPRRRGAPAGQPGRDARCSASTTGVRPSTGSRPRPTTSTARVARLRRRRAVPAGPVFVHGDSAGGNLALVAALRNPGRPRGAGADLPVPRPGRRRFDSYRHRDAAASTRARRPGTGSSTPATPEDLTDPDLAPLVPTAARAPLPPTLVVTAEHDPLARRGRATSPACSPRPVSRSTATRYLGQVARLLAPLDRSSTRPSRSPDRWPASSSSCRSADRSP